MKDGPVRRALKALVRVINALELAARRRRLARVAPPRYRLAGSCNGCGACCEHPSIQVDRVTWSLPTLRRLFLWWQRVVNGFELEHADGRFKLFVFRCTHYEPATKRCDSYQSRPLMCRDYPVNLTFDAVPQLFEACSHTVVDVKAEGLVASLERAGLTGEKLEEVKKKLFLG